MVGEANDPPDAPEDEQSFMHDLTHHAWRLFTKHVAKEAASLSGSSVQTAQQAEAAHGVRSPSPVHALHVSRLAVLSYSSS